MPRISLAISWSLFAVNFCFKFFTFCIPFTRSWTVIKSSNKINYTRRCSKRTFSSKLFAYFFRHARDLVIILISFRLSWNSFCHIHVCFCVWRSAMPPASLENPKEQGLEAGLWARENGHSHQTLNVTKTKTKPMFSRKPLGYEIWFMSYKAFRSSWAYPCSLSYMTLYSAFTIYRVF